MTDMQRAYQQYVDECNRRLMEPLNYNEWLEVDDLVD